MTVKFPIVSFLALLFVTYFDLNSAVPTKYSSSNYKNIHLKHGRTGNETNPMTVNANGE